MTTLSLFETWQLFKKEHPSVRIRDAAVKLNTSEMALIACNQKNIRLKPDMKGILGQLESLGSVMALTRSDHAVHESHGVYRNMKSHGSVAIFLKPGIDARFFLDQWAEVYAVNENDRHSLQFFDSNGGAIHKIYVTEETHYEAFLTLLSDFKTDDKSPQLSQNETSNVDTVDEATLDVATLDVDSDGEEEMPINAQTLRDSWAAIEDVHESGKIIKRYGNHRRNEIYEALGEEYALELDVSSIEKVLEIAAEQSEELMIFVMNDAAVQVYSGTIKKLLRTGPWFNILDPLFNLHLRTAGIGRTWLVKKPSSHGAVTSIDVLDEQGIEFLLITGNKPLNQPESKSWKAIYNNPLLEVKNATKAVS